MLYLQLPSKYTVFPTIYKWVVWSLMVLLLKKSKDAADFSQEIFFPNNYMVILDHISNNVTL